MSDSPDPRANLSPRDQLLSVYHAALAAVHGRHGVSACLQQYPVDGPVYVVAIGKAAAAMYQGAGDVLGPLLVKGLLITRYGHAPELLSHQTGLTVMEAGHPVPDINSLKAGQALIDFLQAAPEQAQFIFLISGGASALVESLARGRTLDQLQQLNDWLLGSGLDIMTMNRYRTLFSSIKGGRLSRYLAGRQTRALYISDVPGDDPAVIGSGLLMPPAQQVSSDALTASTPKWLRALFASSSDVFPDMTAGQSPATAALSNITHTVVADAARARQAAAVRGRQLAYQVLVHDELLLGDVQVVATTVLDQLERENGVLHIWSGEPSVILPDKPGQGGRNQSLALCVALGLDGMTQRYFLSAGTDGSDGNSPAAGAVVDGQTCRRMRDNGIEPQLCLHTAAAYTAFAGSEGVVATGPTGTNVMDLMLALHV